MFRVKFDQHRTKNEEFDFSKVRGGEEEVKLHFKILLLVIIGKYMKMFLFKFNRNRIITKNYFFEGGRVARRGPPILNFNIIYY